MADSAGSPRFRLLEFCRVTSREALDLKCDYTNQNGIVSDQSTRALLTHYGVAIRTQSDAASGSIIFQVDNVMIE